MRPQIFPMKGCLCDNLPNHSLLRNGFSFTSFAFQKLFVHMYKKSAIWRMVAFFYVRWMGDRVHDIKKQRYPTLPPLGHKHSYFYFLLFSSVHAGYYDRERSVEILCTIADYRFFQFYFQFYRFFVYSVKFGGKICNITFYPITRQ